MSTLVVPELDLSYPTLGPQVCDWIEAYLVYGPGDLRGTPYRLDDEKRALVYRMYEVYPQGTPNAGRRRFKRCAISLRKGSAKTEFAAAIAAAELHASAPVRCDGFDADGEPVGVGVRDPYIPMVAYTEEQSEDLAYAALYVMIGEGPLANDFDIGLARIMRKDGNGKAVPLASAPDSRDGARTTFQHFDETHRFTLPRLRQAHQTMIANLPKRKIADAWALETTTAPAPGEGSVAEHTMAYARQVHSGVISDSRLFFFHRQANDKHDLTTDDGVRAAVLEASGPVAEWSDVDAIVEQWRDPSSDRTYLERVWLNRVVRGAERAFDAEQWRKLAAPRTVAERSTVVLGFDGSRRNDATSLVAVEVATGYVWPLRTWQRPYNVDEWEVPVAEVDTAVADAFRRYNVWRLYADPPYWETYIAKWSGEYGAERIVEWWTNRQRAMAYAVRAFVQAIAAGELTHSGDVLLAEHIGNAVRRPLAIVDEDGKPLWVIQKERPDSPAKIDAGMAAILAWEARNDAVAKGVAGRSVYEDRGLLVV